MIYTLQQYIIYNDKDLQKAKAWITKAVELRTRRILVFFSSKIFDSRSTWGIGFGHRFCENFSSIGYNYGNQQYIDLNKKQLAK